MYETSKDGARVTPRPKVVVDPPPWRGRLNPPKGLFYVKLPWRAVQDWAQLGLEAKASRFIESEVTGQVFLAKGLLPVAMDGEPILLRDVVEVPDDALANVTLRYEALVPVGPT